MSGAAGSGIRTASSSVKTFELARAAAASPAATSRSASTTGSDGRSSGHAAGARSAISADTAALPAVRCSEMTVLTLSPAETGTGDAGMAGPRGVTSGSNGRSRARSAELTNDSANHGGCASTEMTAVARCSDNRWATPDFPPRAPRPLMLPRAPPAIVSGRTKFGLHARCSGFAASRCIHRTGDDAARVSGYLRHDGRCPEAPPSGHALAQA